MSLMGRRASEEGMSWIIYLILILVLIIVVIAGVFQFGLIDRVKQWLPGLNDSSGVVRVSDGISIELDNPDDLIYFIYGRNSGTVFYRCYDLGGWYWAGKDRKFYVPYDSAFLDVEDFELKDKKAIEKNKKFIIELTSLNCEEGLQKIVDRIRANEEGNWVYSVDLRIYLKSKVKKVYDSDDEDLKDIRVVIKQLNNLVE